MANNEAITRIEKIVRMVMVQMDVERMELNEARSAIELGVLQVLTASGMKATKKDIKAALDAVLVGKPQSAGGEQGGLIKHPKFEKILKMLQKRKNVYLYGPAGTGKTTTGKMLAEALGVEFYMTGAVNDPIQDLAGFVDAQGQYNDTAFYNAFTKGGLFLFDEMDASCPEALTFINSALANRYYNVPKKGLVKAHPNFYCIGAGNTKGTGADAQYVTRAQLDGATLNRFIPMEFGYCDAMWLMNAKGDSELVEFVHDLKNVLDGMGLNYIVSYRNVSDFVDLVNEPEFTPEEVMLQSFFGYMNDDNIRVVAGNVDRSNKYGKLLRRAAC